MFSIIDITLFYSTRMIILLIYDKVYCWSGCSRYIGTKTPTKCWRFYLYNSAFNSSAVKAAYQKREACVYFALSFAA